MNNKISLDEFQRRLGILSVGWKMIDPAEHHIVTVRYAPLAPDALVSIIVTNWADPASSIPATFDEKLGKIRDLTLKEYESDLRINGTIIGRGSMEIALRQAEEVLEETKQLRAEKTEYFLKLAAGLLTKDQLNGPTFYEAHAARIEERRCRHQDEMFDYLKLLREQPDAK